MLHGTGSSLGRATTVKQRQPRQHLEDQHGRHSATTHRFTSRFDVTMKKYSRSGVTWGAGWRLWLLMLAVMQWCFFCSVVVQAGRYPSTPRDSLDLAPLQASDRAVFGAGSREDVEKVVGDDLRRVPTGANPLHNR